tara:strand:+ start:598 stop:741 length:144 start_codon:yes stop_codon:yes gene_type:complete
MVAIVIKIADIASGAAILEPAIKGTGNRIVPPLYDGAAVVGRQVKLA